jgi:hypothetical protein
MLLGTLLNDSDVTAPGCTVIVWLPVMAPLAVSVAVID